MKSLKDIQQTKGVLPPRILIHAMDKMGKSSFFSEAPNPIFVQTEDGLRGIRTNAFPVAESFTDVLQALDVLRTEDHDFKTVVIDSLDWLETIIHANVCAQHKAETINQAGGGYGAGYAIANTLWGFVRQRLDALNKKGMIIGLICHSSIVKYQSPTTEGYDRFQLKLHTPGKGQGAGNMWAEYVDVLGFIERPILVKKEGTKTQPVNKAVALEGVLNRLHLVGNPAYAAGNRYGLPDVIDLSWAAFEAAFKNTNKEG